MIINLIFNLKIIMLILDPRFRVISADKNHFKGSSEIRRANTYIIQHNHCEYQFKKQS